MLFSYVRRFKKKLRYSLDKTMEFISENHLKVYKDKP